MKKNILSGLVLLSIARYSIFVRQQQNKTNKYQVISAPTPAKIQGPVMGNSNGMMMKNGKYKDGVYTGNVADAFYGNVQVQVTISRGEITDVIFLQYPKDRATSLQISNYSMPYLKQEAIKNQDSQVSIVSGASQTSRAFKESLASALIQAK